MFILINKYKENPFWYKNVSFVKIYLAILGIFFQSWSFTSVLSCPFSIDNILAGINWYFFISSFTNAEETAQGRGILLSVMQEDVSFIPPKYDAFENIRLKLLQNIWENR